MTTAYVTFEYYEDTYLGNVVAESNFARLALRASAVIDRLTFNRAAVETDADKVDAIKMATCAVAEVLQGQDVAPDGTIASESVGSYSVTYVQGSTKSKERAQSDTAALYLGGTGLMFAGFYDGEYSGSLDADE